MNFRLICVVLAGLLTLPAFAEVAVDAIMLSQHGVSPVVMVAWAEQQHLGPLSSQDILRMKDAKVPDAVVAALIHAAAASHVAVAQSEPAATYVAPTTTYVESSPANDYGDYPYYYSDGYGGYGGSILWGVEAITGEATSAGVSMVAEVVVSTVVAAASMAAAVMAVVMAAAIVSAAADVSVRRFRSGPTH